MPLLSTLPDCVQGSRPGPAKDSTSLPLPWPWKPISEKVTGPMRHIHRAEAMRGPSGQGWTVLGRNGEEGFLEEEVLEAGSRGSEMLSLEPNTTS